LRRQRREPNDLCRSTTRELTPTHTSFQTDLTTRGHPAEYLVVEYFRSIGIPAELNPSTDYESLKAFDIIVGNEMFDVKADWFSAVSKRIFVEEAGLRHTKASRWVYVIPIPYGFDLRIFLVTDLIELFNAQVEVRRPDGTMGKQYIYEHGIAGDQRDNNGVFIPLEVARTHSVPPYLAAKELRTQTA
jgi:hypothetical protein